MIAVAPRTDRGPATAEPAEAAEPAEPGQWQGRSTAEPEPALAVGYATRSMGGRLTVHVGIGGTGAANEAEAADETDAAEATARRVASRVDRWASRLTRHDPDSELCRLNADPRLDVPVGPTLAAALSAAREACVGVRGLVDITLLDERLAAEFGPPTPPTGGTEDAVATSSPTTPSPILRAWTIRTSTRGSGIVRRSPGLRFDLGGVGKGWIADRALALLGRMDGAVVDADGDLAIRTQAGRYWSVAIDDPRTADGELTVLRIGGDDLRRTWGVATSGTSIHRWSLDGRATHHLIDPRTRRPATTDVVQATVVADSALRAEAFAKAAVIAGSVSGFALLDRAPIRGAVLLLEDGTVLALPKTLPLMAA